MNTPTPATESSYMELIGKCHAVIDDINTKTIIMQPISGRLEEVGDQPVQYNSTLDRELKQLLNHLKELRDNLFI